jgi:Xaa-Pro aminopeptidase
VHEGPHGISSRFGNMTGLQAGMIVSNEPGYYEDRAFGIRIEVKIVYFPPGLWRLELVTSEQCMQGIHNFRLQMVTVWIMH